MSRPTLVVHGGAGTIAPDNRDAARAGVTSAASEGHRVLVASGDALTAVVAAVRLLEDDPVFNAGRGACMNAAQQFELDAAVMVATPDDARPRHGAIAAVVDLCNPVEVARRVLEDSPHALLAGAGAAAFARVHGGRFDREALWTAKAQARWDAAQAGTGSIDGQADTVGAVALDAAGRLAVACSTGGVLAKAPGRVGDSPLVGVGFYAAAGLGAACATGMGEAIMTRVASYAALARIAAAPRQQAEAILQAVCAEAAGNDATCGLIVVLPDGRPVLAHQSPHMSWAVATADGVEAGIQLASRSVGRI